MPCVTYSLAGYQPSKQSHITKTLAYSGFIDLYLRKREDSSLLVRNNRPHKFCLQMKTFS